MKIRPVGVEILHADGQTDVTQLTAAFRSFANAPKSTRLETTTITIITKTTTTTTIIILNAPCEVN